MKALSFESCYRRKILTNHCFCQEIIYYLLKIGVFFTMPVPLKINTVFQNQIIDFESIAQDNLVVDAGNLSTKAETKRPGFNLPDFRVNAPLLQLLARLQPPGAGNLLF
ncbi:MAG: hypothetical protein R2860_07545 [Desulfobacterales bacterium]